MKLSVNSWPAAVVAVAVLALAGWAFYLRPDAIVAVLGALGLGGALLPAALRGKAYEEGGR